MGHQRPIKTQSPFLLRVVAIAAPAATMAACKVLSLAAKFVYVEFGVGPYLPLFSAVLVSFPVFIAIAASAVAVAFIAIPKNMVLSAVVAFVELVLVVSLFQFW